MKSTTGAYSAFPDYYYATGNLFGTYLRGGSSSSVRGDGVGMHIAPPRSRSLVSRQPELRSELARFVKGRIGREDTIFLYEQLFPDQKLILETSRADPWSALDRRTVTHLPNADQRRIIERLEQAMAVRRKQPRVKPKRRGSGQTSPGAKAARSAKKPRTTNRPATAPAKKVQATQVERITDRVCSLCGVPLTDQDRATCSSAPALFYGRGYCPEHAEKIKALAR